MGNVREEGMKGEGVRSRNWFIVGALGLITLGSFLIFEFGVPRTSDADGLSSLGETIASEPAPEEDAIAPDFKLLNIDGVEVRLSELRGQPVLINFWATWCAPCRLEMPGMQDRFEKFADDGLQILAVNFDEPVEAVQGFSDELGLTFELLLDPGGEIQRAYRIRGYPTSFFLDPNGVIKVLHIGVMTEGQLDIYLAEIGLEG
jgi:peroxiredoxin